MGDALLVHICHPGQNLLHVVLNDLYWNSLLLLLVLLDDVLEVIFAKFENNILSGFSIFTPGIIDL
jgi:hypothetical protein